MRDGTSILQAPLQLTVTAACTSSERPVSRSLTSTPVTRFPSPQETRCFGAIDSRGAGPKSPVDDLEGAAGIVRDAISVSKCADERVPADKWETLSDLVARKRLVRSDGLSVAGQEVVERQSQLPPQPAHPSTTEHGDEKAQRLYSMRRESGEDPTLLQ